MATTNAAPVTDAHAQHLSASPDQHSKPSFSGGDMETLAGIKLDNTVLTRMMYVLVVLALIAMLYFGVKIWRTRSKKKERVYDVLPIHQLGTNLEIDSDSEDDIFDDAHRNLVTASSR